MTTHDPNPLEALLRDLLDEDDAVTAARAIVDAGMYHDPAPDLGAYPDRAPTLGGRIEGTGSWVLDDVALPDGVPHALAVGAPRIALRDPDGGSWANWPALDALDGLRAQLAAGAALIAPTVGVRHDREPSLRPCGVTAAHYRHTYDTYGGGIIIAHACPGVDDEAPEASLPEDDLPDGSTYRVPMVDDLVALVDDLVDDGEQRWRRDMDEAAWSATYRMGLELLRASRHWFPEVYARGDAATINHFALGVAGEAGEVVDIIKKADICGLTDTCDHHPDGKHSIEALKLELGDLLTYVYELCAVLGIDPEAAVSACQEKCASRWGDVPPRGPA